MRRHPVRQHPRRTATGARTMVVNHARGTGATSQLARHAALPDLTTRFLGSCQICAGDFKLDAQNLVVHHGYKRPGDGRIHGDCMAVGYPPYEVSCERCKPYLAMLRHHADGVRSQIANLQDPALETFSGESFLHDRPAPVFTRGVTSEHEWNYQLKYKIDRLKSTLFSIEREIDRIVARIANWKRQPIRTIEERTRQLAEKADVRKGERDVARAAKQAKIDATKAKQAALVAKRTTIVDAFRSEVEDVYARKIAGEDVAKRVQKLSDKMHTDAFLKAADRDVRGALNRWPRYAGHEVHDSVTDFDRKMLALGLAHTSSGRVWYR